MLELKTIVNSDIRFLYELLKNRPLNVNISHKKMPTYKKHEKFVKSKPYSKWYVIFLNKEPVGTIYLSKQNEIGIHFSSTSLLDKIGIKVIVMLMKKNPRKRYLVNVNPQNKKMINFLSNNKFKILQQTYELKKDN